MSDNTLNWPGDLALSKNRPGQVDLTGFKDKLDRFQSDAIDYLYDLEPQSQNLFWVGYFCEASQGEDMEKAFYNAAYRIRKITIPMPKMEIDQNNILRAPIFKNANFTQEISIEWIEDVYHSVQKYHLDWFARWYNRQYDVLRCGVHGKFRKLLLVAYHYVNSDTDSLIEVPAVQPLMIFHVGGLIPLQLPDMTFDYSADQNETPLNMTYKCSRIQWVYSDKVGMGQKADIWGGNKGITGLKSGNGVETWNPQGFESDVSPDKDQLFEQLRIARAATSYQLSEGSIG